MPKPAPAGDGQCLGGRLGHAAGVPVSEAVSVQRTLGEGSGSSRDHTPVAAMPPAQVQAPVVQPEAALRVVQRRQRVALLLRARHTGPRPHRQLRLDVLERLRPRLREVPDDPLLRNRSPSRSHAIDCRASVSVLPSCAGRTTPSHPCPCAGGPCEAPPRTRSTPNDAAPHSASRAATAVDDR